MHDKLKEYQKINFTCVPVVDINCIKRVKVNDFGQTWQSCLNSIKLAESKDVDFVLGNSAISMFLQQLLEIFKCPFVQLQLILY